MMAACIFASSPNGGDAPPYGPPVAAFAPSDPVTPIYSTVNFYDQSTDNPTSWEWRLGDENGTIFSIDQNSSYYFTSPGSYPITLVVTNEYGTDFHTIIIEVFY
jgi:PKD repeat protein